eukprot:Awhi_evm1s15726
MLVFKLLLLSLVVCALLVYQVNSEACNWPEATEKKVCRTPWQRCGCKTRCCSGSICKGNDFWKTCRPTGSSKMTDSNVIQNDDGTTSTRSELCGNACLSSPSLF